MINKIHYNRAIIQIGLACFRLGRFDESNDILTECQTPRLKDSLAQLNLQGYGQRIDKPYEEEEREIQMPPHLTINLETLDCVYMTTSMFLEIPNISENKHFIHKKVISKNFRNKLIDQYDQKGLQFLPQNSRDYIVFAARELHRSNWEEAFEHISNIKVFQKMDEF